MGQGVRVGTEIERWCGAMMVVSIIATLLGIILGFILGRMSR